MESPKYHSRNLPGLPGYRPFDRHPDTHHLDLPGQYDIQAARTSSHPGYPLSALGGSGRLHWFLNAEPIAVIPAGSSGTIPLPPPGAYQLAVADDNGHVDMVRFTVISLD